jgi:hypothetical protein
MTHRPSSSLVIPGEDKLTINDKCVEDLLEIRNDYKESVPQATISRRINREQKVSRRKLENVFVEEKQPIMQQIQSSLSNSELQFALFLYVILR